MRLIDADALKKEWGFGDKCEECPQNVRICQYEQEFSRMDICEMLDDAPTVCGWISVKDRLPPSQDMVIVAINDASGDTPYRYSYFGWYMQDASCWIIDNEIRRGEVYAWRPLPEPPKKGEEYETDRR